MSVTFVSKDSIHSRHPHHPSCHDLQREKHKPFRPILSHTYAGSVDARYSGSIGADMVPKRAHQWTADEGVVGLLLQSNMTLVVIRHVCHARLEVPVIERQRITSQSHDQKKR